MIITTNSIIIIQNTDNKINREIKNSTLLLFLINKKIYNTTKDNKNIIMRIFFDFSKPQKILKLSLKSSMFSLFLILFEFIPRYDMEFNIIGPGENKKKNLLSSSIFSY